MKWEGGVCCRNTQTEVQQLWGKVLPFYRPSYQSHFPVSNVKLLPGNENLPTVSPLSTASFLSRKEISLHPFSVRMVFIFPFHYIQPRGHGEVGRKKKFFLISAGCSSLVSNIVSLGIFPLATHTAVLNLNHTEVTWNSHTCQFYSHTSSAITSLKTIRPSFTLAKLYKKKKKNTGSRPVRSVWFTRLCSYFQKSFWFKKKKMLTVLQIFGTLPPPKLPHKKINK